MELGLNDKKVLISASVQGIGLSTAEMFLKEGAAVWINGRNKDRLDKTQKELEMKYGNNRVKCFAGDVSKRNVVQEWFYKVKKDWGYLDVLVPNLGAGKPQNHDMMDINEWEYMMNINLYSTVDLINTGYPLLKDGKAPCIVMLSSVAAFEKTTAPYAYASAKAGLITLTKYLSVDYAKDNIRVNAVVPGNIYFQGGRWEELLEEDKESVLKYIEKNVPLGRFGNPEEIANAIVFLASDKSLFTTGAILNIDGGQKRG